MKPVIHLLLLVLFLSLAATATAQSAGRDHVVGPLNHLLWLIDAHSLDADYRETDRTFLITLQPSGRKFARIDCPVTRAS